MGSLIEINDTLQITKAQGFPQELAFEQHQIKPFKIKDFKDKIFEFNHKPKIRVYHTPPVRTFLVENIDGQWLYWGLIHIIEVNHDYQNQTTSGKFKIIKIYTPEQMKQAYQLIDGREEFDYLG